MGNADGGNRLVAAQGPPQLMMVTCDPGVPGPLAREGPDGDPGRGKVWASFLWVGASLPALPGAVTGRGPVPASPPEARVPHVVGVGEAEPHFPNWKHIRGWGGEETPPPSRGPSKLLPPERLQKGGAPQLWDGVPLGS